MDQQGLFHEDIYDAVRSTVQRLGGPKKVGCLLWPDQPPEKAGQRMLDCLNRDRREVLNPEQLLFLAKEGRKSDCHTILAYLCEEAGYRPPEPIEPVDEMAQLQRDHIEAVKLLKVLAEKFERAQIRLGRDLKIAGEAR